MSLQKSPGHKGQRMVVGVIVEQWKSGGWNLPLDTCPSTEPTLGHSLTPRYTAAMAQATPRMRETHLSDTLDVT